MLNALLISRAGLADATSRLDRAATRIAAGPAQQGVAPVREVAPVTGATGGPAGAAGDTTGALLDLMSAEMSFKANVEVLRTQAQMVRSLYETFD